MTLLRCEMKSLAKLNLRLKIEGRRPDGYHKLSMLNVLVSLSDQIRIEVEEGDGVVVRVSGMVPSALRVVLENSEKNLAGRAAKLFCEAWSLKQKVVIHLDKVIPAGAGMGGGSSNAATVLAMLAKIFYWREPGGGESCMWSTREETKLRQLALTLGADVPYFLNPGFCLVSGIGEDLRYLPGLVVDGVSALIIVPPFATATADIYNKFRDMTPELSLGASRPDEDGLKFAGAVTGGIKEDVLNSSFMWNRLLSLISNDLAPVVCEQYPQMKELLRLGNQEAGYATAMTGSGSVLFCLPREREGAETDLPKIERRFAKCGCVTHRVTLLSQVPE